MGRSSILSLCLESLGIHEQGTESVCRNSDTWSEYTPVIGDGIGVQGGRGSAGTLGGLLHFWISVCRSHVASQQCGVPSSSAFRGNAKPITAQCHCRAQLGNLQHQWELPACYQGPISKNTLEGLNIPTHTAYHSILIVPASKCRIWKEAVGFIFSRQEKHISKQVLAQPVQSARINSQKSCIMTSPAGLKAKAMDSKCSLPWKETL